jgi:peptide/nickel transport system permease protein
MRVLESEWWLWMPPGIMVFLTIISINFLGDGLRDALDPKLKA